MREALFLMFLKFGSSGRKHPGHRPKEYDERSGGHEERRHHALACRPALRCPPAQHGAKDGEQQRGAHIVSDHDGAASIPGMQRGDERPKSRQDPKEPSAHRRIPFLTR